MHQDCRKASPPLGDIFINSVFFPCSDLNVQNGETCFCVSFTKGHVIKRLREGHDPDEPEIPFLTTQPKKTAAVRGVTRLL